MSRPYDTNIKIGSIVTYVSGKQTERIVNRFPALVEGKSFLSPTFIVTEFNRFHTQIYMLPYDVAISDARKGKSLTVSWLCYNWVWLKDLSVEEMLTHMNMHIRDAALEIEGRHESEL